MKDPSKPAKHVLILLAATAWAARDKICHPGQSGLFLPFFGDSEQELSTAAEWGRGFLYFRALYYLLGLLWFFLGVSIIADIFMAAIECARGVPRRCLHFHATRIMLWVVSCSSLSEFGRDAREMRRAGDCGLLAGRGVEAEVDEAGGREVVFSSESCGDP